MNKKIQRKQNKLINNMIKNKTINQNKVINIVKIKIAIIMIIMDKNKYKNNNKMKNRRVMKNMKTQYFKMKILKMKFVLNILQIVF